MDLVGEQISLLGLDSTIDSLFVKTPLRNDLEYHFSQGEEFFIRIDAPIDFPSLPIHHDYRLKKATALEYSAYRQFFCDLAPYLGHFFAGMRYFFDPSHNQKPSFVQVLKIEEQLYAFLIKIDMSYRASHATVTKKASNDISASFKSCDIFLESDLIPLRSLDNKDGSYITLAVDTSISETWVGETGRGYFVQGIWLDREISRFISKLFVANGHKIYPFFPLLCKYKTVCFQTVDMSQDGRKRGLSFLHQARKFLKDYLSQIEGSIKDEEFSENNPVFVKMRPDVPVSLTDYTKTFKVKTYLDKDDQKEYEITF